ncbi:2,4-dienoyl-CoA reductase [Paramicrobacterium humi]|uniref:2,4-dienoyl-CoA reductase n=1 Tax=Paramicrobacterium humi TaxID=640635 RepID=A0A1H4P5X9_9MICO|nr:NADH:flavin oxidoreductase/NADH oxidase [Microbacterium humi]SEC02876.1 2,4-dienoyl-CoA reductase [Microbacterium humi]
MSALFSPIDVGPLVIRNRVWLSPMCQYSCMERDGMPAAWHLIHLGGFAAGGFGLVMTEATAVSAEGRISDRDTGIWTDEQASAWAPIVEAIRAQGATAGIQLAHAGRKASTYAPWGAPAKGTIPAADGGWSTVAPSDVAFEGYVAPVALDAEGIDKVVADFVAAAVRACTVGFEAIEIHAAHGYLLHQFLSPLSNRRDDEYGGSLENRARLLLRIVREVRAVIGARALLVRLSGTDWAEEGEDRWDAEACAQVARAATEAGADGFDISSGGILAHPSIPLGPGYQVPFAETVRAAVDVPVSAVGLITDAEQAERIVADGRADAVMLGREALRNPQLANAWSVSLAAGTPGVPGQYERAY